MKARLSLPYRHLNPASGTATNINIEEDHGVGHIVTVMKGCKGRREEEPGGSRTVINTRRGRKLIDVDSVSSREDLYLSIYKIRGKEQRTQHILVHILAIRLGKFRQGGILHR